MKGTANLSLFGYRERANAEKLLHEWNNQKLPIDFYDENVHLMMNQNSGDVFLTNSEHEVAILNGGKLKSYYSCPICGHEGFLEDIEHTSEEAGCKQWINSIKEIQE